MIQGEFDHYFGNPMRTSYMTAQGVSYLLQMDMATPLYSSQPKDVN